MKKLFYSSPLVSIICGYVLWVIIANNLTSSIEVQVNNQKYKISGKRLLLKKINLINLESDITNVPENLKVTKII